MTREEFIKVLENHNYSYKIEGDKLVIARNKYDIILNDLVSIPPNVVFENLGSTFLKGLENLPTGVIFENGWNVYLSRLTTLTKGIVFKNAGDSFLDNLTSISPGVVFKNTGGIRLRNLIGGWFYDWADNIEGVNNKRLLNLMISKGIFER